MKTRTIRILLGAVIGLTLAACDPSTDTSFGTHLDRAAAFESEGELTSAALELKNAIQIDRASGEARARLGEIYRRLGEINAARKELARALALGVREPQTVASLAEVTIRSGEFEAALDLIARNQDALAESAAAVLRGNALLGLKQIEKAEESFQHALDTEPDSALARVGLARVAVANKDNTTARGYIDAALQVSPSNVEALLFRSVSALGQGNLEAAEAALRTAYGHDPHDPRIQISLAQVLISANQLDEGEQVLDKAVKDTPLTQYLRAKLALHRHQSKQARDILRRVLADAPQFAPASLLLASLEFTAGEIEQARARLERYVAAVPQHIAARKLLAAIYLRQNNAQSAARILEPIASAPDFQLNLLLARSYAELGMVREGVDALERASELRPDSAASQTQLATYYLALGNEDRAVALLTTATTLEDEIYGAGMLLSMTHMRQGNFEAARNAALAIADSNADNPIGFYLLGLISHLENQPAKARQYYAKAHALNPEYGLPLEGLAQLDIEQGRYPSARQRYNAIIEANLAGKERATVNLAALDMLEGKTASARERYEGLLAQNSRNPMVLDQLARILLRTRADRKRALELLEDLRRIVPRAVEPRLLLAEEYLARRNFAMAEEVAGEVLSADPDNPRGLNILSLAQWKLGNERAAISITERLAGIEPENVRVRVQLALFHQLQGDSDAARKALERALTIDPVNIQARVAMARLHLATGAPEKALEMAHSIRRLDSETAASFALEGDALSALSRPEGAAEAYARAYALNSSVSLATKHVRALWRAGRKEDAFQWLRAQLREDPMNHSLRLVLAGSYEYENATAEAISEYEALLARSSNHPIALNNLALLKRDVQPEEAFSMVQRARKVAPDLPALMDTEAQMLIDSGNLERAIQLLREAISKSPRNPVFRHHLAIALARAGELEEARSTLAEVLRASGQFRGRAEAQELWARLR